MKIGNTEIVDVKIGTSQISKVMQGSSEVWTNVAPVQDNNYIYFINPSTKTIQKYLKTDLTYVGQSASLTTYSLHFSTTKIASDETYLYIAGDNLHLQKFLKSDLSYVGSVWSSQRAEHLVVDEDSIYFGGQLPYIRKYNKSTLVNTLNSPYNSLTSVYQMHLDGDYLYASGISDNLPRRFLKSDLSLVSSATQSYNNTIMAMDTDDTYLYVGGYNRVYKYNKTTLAYVSNGANIGTTITFIKRDDSDGLFVSGGNSGTSISRYRVTDFARYDYTGAIGYVYTGIMDDTYIYVFGSFGSIKKYDRASLNLIAESSVINLPPGSATF